MVTCASLHVRQSHRALPTCLVRVVPSALAEREQVTFRDFKRALFSTIPALIAVPFDPGASSHHWFAVGLDVMEKINQPRVASERQLAPFESGSCVGSAESSSYNVSVSVSRTTEKKRPEIMAVTGLEAVHLDEEQLSVILVVIKMQAIWRGRRDRRAKDLQSLAVVRLQAHWRHRAGAAQRAAPSLVAAGLPPRASLMAVP